MIEKIKIKNLTVFEELEIATNYPINVFIGENGTGKTQLLKFIYMILNFDNTYNLDRNASAFPITIKNFFGSGLDSITDLLNNKKEEDAYFILHHEKEDLGYNIMHSLLNELIDVVLGNWNFYGNSIYIPAKNMLTHSKGLPAMKKEYGSNMPFDETYINIIEKASKWNKQEIPEIAKEIVLILEDIMDGVVKIVNEVFYIKKRNGRMISFDFEAEGLKKIGLLWQLLMNESITEGSILLWDEPEANLNPNLTSIIANILLELSRNGVQIFLSTHSYFLAEYLDVLEHEENECMFHSLYKTENNGVKCESNASFSKLSNNLIIDEHINLYDAEIEKVMG